MADDIEIRPARPEDGPALQQSVERINNETKFLGVPGQGHPWDGRFAEELRRLAETASGAVLLALAAGGEIVGYLSAFRGGFARNRGSLFIAVVGLRAAWRRRGIGTRLFAAVEDWARAQGSWRLDLRVSALNARGQALYRKCGFAVEGRIREGVMRDGAWSDDLWMAKLLDPRLPALPMPRSARRRRPRQHAVGTLVVRELRRATAPACATGRCAWRRRCRPPSSSRARWRRPRRSSATSPRRAATRIAGWSRCSPTCTGRRRSWRSLPPRSSRASACSTTPMSTSRCCRNGPGRGWPAGCTGAPKSGRAPAASIA